MDDKALAAALAAAIVAEHKAHCPAMQSTDCEGKIADIIAWLRTMNVPWSKILAFIGPILQLLLSGGTLNLQAIIAAIMALLFPTPPTPAPGPVPAQP